MTDIPDSAVEAGAKAVHDLVCVEGVANGECDHGFTPWDDTMAHHVLTAALPHLTPAVTPRVVTSVEELRLLDPKTAMRTEGGLLIEAGRLVYTIEQGPFTAEEMACLPAAVLTPAPAEDPSEFCPDHCDHWDTGTECPYAESEATLRARIAGEWANYFENHDMTVGTQPLTTEDVVRLLRGPQPFGVAARLVEQQEES